MDPKPVADLVRTLKNSPGHLVHSVIIAVDGRLVLEVYFDGFTHPTYGEDPISYGRETRHCLSSVAKSVTATLLGIAIDRGFIAGVDDRAFDFFPELGDLNIGQKSDITLEHLVTMSSGLEWDEWTYPIGDPRNDLMKWLVHDGDLVRFVLERSSVADPGAMFRYNGGLTNILGEVIHRASGLILDRFSELYLFDLLGISDFSWIHVRPDFVYASGDISLRPRDMAKLGQLYLQGGNWEGEQLLPRAWIDASASAYLALDSEWQGHVGYSYGWWPKSEAYGAGAFAASGWGDQAIIVVPEFDMVAVFTGGSYWEDPLMESHEMMLGYVLPAVR
jgi:CubicO group peptidase (beta-lactamase class C family)